MPTERTDPELMAAFQQGDAVAFEELVERHHRGLINFFYHYAHDRQLAEDWTQEVFLRVVHHAPSYVPRARFTTFLYRIARNLWIDVIRERAVHKRPASLDAHDESGERREEWVPSAATQQPADTLASEEVSAQVRRVLDQLPPELRDVVILSELQGLKYAEIGETLGIPVGTVKSRMHTAVQRLRVLLAPLAGGSSPGAGPAPAGERGAAGGVLPALLLAAAALAGAHLAASQSPAPEPAAPVETLVARLSHEDWAERDAARKALVARGAAAVPALAGLIAGSPDPDAALQATEALRQIGWPALVHLMDLADAPPPLAKAREACARAFLEGAISKDSLGENVPAHGNPPGGDAGAMQGIWETGSKNDPCLRLYRFRWEGGHLRVDRLVHDRFAGPESWGPEEIVSYPAICETTVVPAATARAMFRMVMRASALRLERISREADVTLLPGGGRIDIGPFRVKWSSTTDFHSRVRLTEGVRVVVDESFTGCPGSDHEMEYVRADVASVVLATALKGAAWKERPAGEEDRAFLLDRTGRFGEDSEWVRERLLIFINMMGDRRFEPFLRKVIEMPPGDGKPDRNRHAYAFEACARILGVDLRTKPRGKMDIASVREAYLRYFEGRPAASEPEKR